LIVIRVNNFTEFYQRSNVKTSFKFFLLLIELRLKKLFYIHVICP